MARCIWVSLPKATFAVITEDGMVVDTAPYGWALIKRLGSRDERIVAAHLRKLGAEFREMPVAYVRVTTSLLETDPGCLRSFKFFRILSMDEMSIEAARPKLGEIIDRARIAGEATLITRVGKPAAVVVNVDWYTTAIDVCQVVRQNIIPVAPSQELDPWRMEPGDCQRALADIWETLQRAETTSIPGGK